MQPAGDEKVLRMNKDKVFFSEYPNKTNVSKIRSGVRNDEERESRFMGNSKDSKAPLLERPLEKSRLVSHLVTAKNR